MSMPIKCSISYCPRMSEVCFNGMWICFEHAYPTLHSLSSTSHYGGMGGYCSHTDVQEEEFITVCVELFGGSFSELFHRLAKRGYKVVK